MQAAAITRKTAAAITAFLLLFQTNQANALSLSPEENNNTDYSLSDTELEYNDYLALNSDGDFADSEIILDAKNTDNISNTAEQDGKICNILNDANNTVTYAFEVTEAGMYNLSITYYELLNEDLSISLGFYFDGTAPYTELENLTFSKIYENEQSKIEVDEFGNQIRPTMVMKQRFNTEYAESTVGAGSSPYAVYLSKGSHKLTVKRILGNLLISQISLNNYEEAPAYDEYIAQYSGLEIGGTEKYVIEAENTFEVNSSTLGATVDSTDAGMSPSSSTVRLVNGFGKNYWNSNGQWASWIVPENLNEGLYKISFRAKQTGSVGVASYRTLYVNGKVPFKEAKNIEFEYNSKWQIKTLGDSNAYLIYLKPGDVITLEATTGEMADILNEIYSVTDTLNDIYQSIIMITGTSPDTNRDYNLQAEIPTLLDDLENVSGKISKIADEIELIMKKPNSKVYLLRRFVSELESYIANYRIIAEELDSFKDYIDSFVAQTYDFNNLSLELDWIEISKKDAEPSEANAGALEAFIFEIKRFVYTFTSKYKMNSSSDGENGKEIVVWCGLGRDQAQSVKSIIENDFIPQSGTAVNFRMTASPLSEAILAGREPDVSLSVAQDVPVDLALRGQVLDLTPYLDALPEKYIAQFNDSSWLPFQYKGGTYAMPITQDYYMMFYRKDILSKLGIEPPETWEEMYYVIRELQKSNFKVGIREADSSSAGISTAISVFDMFLYQNGGTYFNSDLTATAFESPEGKKAFQSWVSLYRDYGLDNEFDLLTRFRSGEMPIILTNYTFYMTLSATAQEISGRWEMALIPGTEKDDGQIDRTETSTVTGTIILKGAERRGVADEAFEFVKWWADCDTQLKYISAMESIQGIAGRLATANTAAFESLGWSDQEKNVLEAQRKWVTAVNQVPGIYMINRSLTNALRTSYESTAIDPLRQLSIQNSVINDEITRKRSEFEKNN